MDNKLLEKMEESINKILNDGLNTTNLDTLMKLAKIKHYTKEDMNMNNQYNGRGPGYDSYGENYNNYGNYGVPFVVVLKIFQFLFECHFINPLIMI